MIEYGRLARGDALILAIEGHVPAFAFEKMKRAGFQMRAVSDFGGEPVGGWRAIDPMDLGHGETAAGVLQVTVRVGDVEDILFQIFSHDIPRPGAQAQTLPLSDGVKPDSAMLPEDFAGI